MRAVAVLTLLLACTACDPGDAPAEEGKEAQTAEPAAAQGPVAKGRFAPRNECGEIPGADDFKQRLIEAVQLRDAGALASMAADDIKLDFGGGGGTAELRRRLTAEPYTLWIELAELLSLGCASDKRGGIIIPWIAGQDLGAIDPFATSLVTGEDVPIHTQARASSPVIARVSWTLVNLAAFEPERPFQHVAVPGTDGGYIATNKLRNVVDYRLLAAPRDGEWRILALVAGD